jgi:hypothetical protein
MEGIDMRAMTSREKWAQTTSSLGAGILGLGLGALLHAYLGRSGLALAALGALMHAWGMWDMRRLETAAGAARPAWSTALYWICWLFLAGLAIRLALR